MTVEIEHGRLPLPEGESPPRLDKLALHGVVTLDAPLTLRELDDAVRAHRHDCPTAEPGAHLRQHGLTHHHVGNPEVARQELHAGEGAALAQGQDARDAREVRDGLGQQVDSLALHRLFPLLEGQERSAGKTGVEGDRLFGSRPCFRMGFVCWSRDIPRQHVIRISQTAPGKGVIRIQFYRLVEKRDSLFKVFSRPFPPIKSSFQIGLKGFRVFSVFLC